ncbi:MAG: tetratricopeptide repeat protein [Ignavibacteria bacterium]|jgi:tetratricopeptide (TPR) repeat protein|nr:tetratricopeptide repeat protein [Ignavibacteria bacterium]MDH7526621.1 tetratricopeptide repeat protein [Ignavibacteria bacterium]
MKLFRALAIIILFTLSLQAQEMNPEAAKLYNDGNQKMKEGNFSAALQLYEQALKIQKDYRILYQKGIAHRRMNQLDQAYNDLTEALKLKPDFDLAYNALGTLEYTRGNYEQSVNNFLKTLELTKNAQLKNQVEKNISLSYLKLGDQYLKNFEYEKAIDNLKKAIQYDQKNDAAYLALARAYVETGKYDDALVSADNALKYRNKIPKGGIYYYKGLALKNLGKLNEAKAAFEEGKKDPTYKAVCDYEIKNLPKQ